MDTQKNVTVASSARRWLSYCLCFLMSFYQVSPAWAKAFSDNDIDQALASSALFALSANPDVRALYEAAAHVDEQTIAQYESYWTLEKFNSLMMSARRTTLGKLVYVPINVGDITTIIPTYPDSLLHDPAYSGYESVGTAYVQSGYVTKQLQNLLGRTLIDPALPGYASEEAQLQTLYNNALSFARASTSYVFGQPLKRQQDNNLEHFDFIWPEVRVVQGQKVLVPIVYLSAATVDAREVNGTVNEVDGNMVVQSLVIDNVDINLGRDSFIKLANDLVNYRGTISSEGDLEIVAGGAVRNISGVIDSAGDLSITASRIENRTLVYRYDLGGTQGQYLGEIAAIQADKSLLLTSHGDIEFFAATAEAGEDITLDAGGNIYLGAEPLYDNGYINEGGWNGSWSSVDHLVSKLSAGGALSLIADGEIVVDAAQITSQGHIEILAGLGITVDSLTSSEQYAKKGKFGKKKIEISAYQTVAIRALLDAGKDIRLHTEMGDITLRSAEIRSTGGTSVTASNGAINLLVTKETDHYSYSSVKNSAFTTTIKSKGHDIETVVHNTIIGGFEAEALYGLNVEYEGDKSLSLDVQVAELSKFEGLEWMADVRANHPEVDWTAIDTRYEVWKESNTSLNAAAMAVIMIVAIVATAGAAASAAGSIVSAVSSASTAATATTVATTTIAGVTVSTAAATTVVAAGVSSLFVSASVALANGAVNGDVGQAIDDLASSETIKSVATAMVTAGAIQAINADFFNVTQAEAAVEAGEQINSILYEAAEGAAALESAYQLTFVGQAMQAVTHATASGAIQTLVNGDSLSDFVDDIDTLILTSLAQNAVNQLGERLATAIGVASKPTKNAQGEVIAGPDINQITRYLAHAGAGCLTGALTSEIHDGDVGSGCSAGAGGAVVGEFIGDLYIESKADQLKEVKDFLEAEKVYAQKLKDQKYTDAEIYLELTSNSQRLYYENVLKGLEDKGVSLARLGGAMSAFLAGADAEGVSIAADTGEIAAANNGLALLPVVPPILNVIASLGQSVVNAAVLVTGLYTVSQLTESLSEAGIDQVDGHFWLSNSERELEIFGMELPDERIYEKLINGEMYLRSDGRALIKTESGGYWEPVVAGSFDDADYQIVHIEDIRDRIYTTPAFDALVGNYEGGSYTEQDYKDFALIRLMHDADPGQMVLPNPEVLDSLVGGVLPGSEILDPDWRRHLVFQVDDVARGVGTVFDSIKATQGTINGTSIPKSFELASEGGKFWVHPNATKHMAEYLTRNGLSHSSSTGSQAMLTSFLQAVNQATSQGFKNGEMVNVGRWELIFSGGRSGDALPVIKHALYK